MEGGFLFGWSYGMILCMSEKKRVYLDWAAATPLLPEAKAAMDPYFSNDFANPSSIHQEGVVARRAVEDARREAARILGVKPEFLTFTSGGTEGNNLAILGTIQLLRQAGRAYSDMAVITTKIEHPSILRAVEYLADLGVEVRYVRVNEVGKVDLMHMRELLDEKAVLVSVAYANSEIGTIQPLHAIHKCISEAEARHVTTIAFHVDAAQAPLWLPCQLTQIGVDLLVLDMAKCCGPKGVGVLMRSRRTRLAPVLFGGGQEQGLRSGTENVPGIIGATVALVWAAGQWRERSDRVRSVRDEAIMLLLRAIPGVVLNGPDGDDRLANNINISIPGLDTEYATIVLDSKGFAVGTKSACSGAGGGESAVVKEVTDDSARAVSTLRISLGPDTVAEDLNALVDTLRAHVARSHMLPDTKV
jgi:cysteine desulfurase